MIKLPKFILNIATWSLVISIISLIIGFLSKEESTTQGIFYGITLYGIIITSFLLLFHLFLTIISFIIGLVRHKFPRFILNIATSSLIISLISVIIGFLSKEESTTQGTSYGIALYGTIITINLLLLHLILTVIAFIIDLIRHKDRS